MGKRPPHSYFADLARDRLQIVADLMVQVRNEVVDQHQPELGDGPWGLGCRSYDRTRHRIIALADEHDWLSILDPTLSFVFSIGDVPIRFHREQSEEPIVQLGTQPIYAATQTTMEFVGASESHLRLVVVVDDDQRPLRIDLVRYAERCITEDRWVILAAEDRVANIHPLRAPGRDLGPAAFTLKSESDSRSDDRNSSEGVDGD